MANVDCGTHSVANRQREAAAKAARANSPAPASVPPPAPLAPPAVASRGAIVPDDALTPSQRNAITLLARGRSIKATAQRIGVHRDTVHRWLREDHLFRAAYYTWKAEVQESAEAQLLSLAAPAVKAYGQAIHMGDLRAAGQLLKGLGFLAPSRHGPKDPGESRRLAELEQAERDSTLTEKENAVFQRVYRAHIDRPIGVPERHERKSREAIKKHFDNPNYFGPEPQSPEKGTDKTQPD